jgi:uncharacterized membrane protein
MLSAVQVHLAINHFPIAGIFFTIFFLLMGLIFKKKMLISAAMFLAILSGIAIIPMILSGDGAEEIVEHKAGVTRELIHSHEELADTSVVIFELTAILAILWFIVSKKKETWMKKIEILTLLLAIVASIFIANTAHTGGMIRHEEIRPKL